LFHTGKRAELETQNRRTLQKGDQEAAVFSAAPWRRQFDRLYASVEGKTEAKGLLSRRSFSAFQFLSNHAGGSFLPSE
jgi:hypothetical protein